MRHEQMVESGAESWYVLGSPPKCETGDFQTESDGDDGEAAPRHAETLPTHPTTARATTP